MEQLPLLQPPSADPALSSVAKRRLSLDTMFPFLTWCHSLRKKSSSPRSASPFALASAGWLADLQSLGGSEAGRLAAGSSRSNTSSALACCEGEPGKAGLVEEEEESSFFSPLFVCSAGSSGRKSMLSAHSLFCLREKLEGWVEVFGRREEVE